MRRTDTIPDDYHDVHFVDGFNAIGSVDYSKPQPANLIVWRRELELKIFEALAWHMKDRLEMTFNSSADQTIHEMAKIADQTHGDVSKGASKIFEDGMALYKGKWKPTVYLEWGTPPPFSDQSPPQDIPHADGLDEPYWARIMAQYSSYPTLGFRHDDVKRDVHGYPLFDEFGAAVLEEGATPYSLGFGNISAHSALFVHKPSFSTNPEEPPRIRTMWDCYYSN